MHRDRGHHLERENFNEEDLSQHEYEPSSEEVAASPSPTKRKKLKTSTKHEGKRKVKGDINDSVYVYFQLPRSIVDMELVEKYHISNFFKVKVPPLDHWPCVNLFGYVFVYLVQLEVGLKFPLPLFFHKILDHYQVGFGQLHAKSICNINAYLITCVTLGVKPSIDTFKEFKPSIGTFKEFF
ncbi:hypothetical protein ACH5RR_013701 [Cinchona calisaya]|uniref:Transposase (putative) gypsy type domain-containing protein n=1 Tax=Cinchona calisaya TaxID=153742 RepID=A0ABD3A0R6_9GENT